MADKAEFEIELIDDVTRPARKAESSLQRLKKSLQRFGGGALGKMTATLGRVTKIAGAVGSAISAALGAGISALTVGMVDFAQRSRQAFGLLAKQGEVPEQLFQRSVDLATRLGTNIQDTTKQIQKFRALQFSQDQSEALIKMGSDMKALGASTDEVSRIWLQLGQIQAKGRLQGEELTTLAESGVSTGLVMAALAKKLGKTTTEVQKLVSAGQVGSGDALNAIGTAILAKTGTTAFGQAGEQMATSTLSGMAGVLRSKVQGLFLKVADKAGPAIQGAFGKIFTELDSFMASDRGTQLIDDMAAAMTGLAQGVEKAIPFVKELFKGFDAGFGEALSTFGAAFKDLFGGISGNGEQGLAIVRSFGKALGNLTVALGAVILAFGGVAGAIGVAVTYIVESWKGIFTIVTDTIGGIAFAVTDWFANLGAIFRAEGLSLGEKALALGGEIVRGLVNGIKALAMLPVETMMKLASNAIGAAKSALGISSPSKVFEDIGKNTAIGFSLGLQDLPTQNIIHSTLGNDNGMGAPVRGNLAGGEARAIRTGGGSVRVDVGGIHVTPPPGMTSEQAKDLGRTVGDEFFRHIHAYFDDMVIEEAV